MCSHMRYRFLSPCQSPLKRLYGNALSADGWIASDQPYPSAASGIPCALPEFGASVLLAMRAESWKCIKGADIRILSEQ